MALQACSLNTPSYWLALRAAAKAPKRTEGKQVEDPLAADLGLHTKARRCSRDMKPGHLPRVCGQVGEKVAPNHVPHDWLVPLVEQLLFRQQPKREEQERWRHPEGATMQHAPLCHHSGINGKLCVFPIVGTTIATTPRHCWC